MINVVVTDLEYKKSEDVFKNADGFECISAPSDEKGLSEIIRQSGAKYAIVGVTKYSNELYDTIPNGGVIARFGVGHDGIDKVLAKSKGIFCTNTPGALDDSVAECAMGMIMTAARHLAACSMDNKNGNWKNRVGSELSGKTLAIIGCGNIGRKLAKIAKNGFGMHIIGNDNFRPVDCSNIDEYTDSFATAVQNADFVSLHIPDIAATKNFINAERLNQMKQSAYLINTARGGVVDEDSVYDAVKAGQIAGAVLDVFKNEPYIPAIKNLRELDNVIMTPHIGSSTTEACNRMAESCLKNISFANSGHFDSMSIILHF
ncbi:MAG: NAD(P)-dependent oxidoreductase [Bacteroidales bacterium]